MQMDFIKNLNIKNKNTVVLFFILSFLFYGITLKNKYSLDDEYITVTNFPVNGQAYKPNNKLVDQGLLSIPKIWTSRYAHDSENSFDYRPVVTTTFAIEYGLFGQSPAISHLINVLLYFFTICLLYKCLLKLFENLPLKSEISFLTCILFLIHPLHTEVVASLKSRDEMLAFFFGLHFLYQSMLWVETKKIKHILWAVLFIFLGYFSKQSAILFIPALPLVLIFYKKINIKVIIGVFIFLVLVFIGFSSFNNFIVTEKEVRIFYHFENPLFTEKVGFLDKIFIGIKSFGFYIKMLIFPYPLRFYYGVNTFDFTKKINFDFVIALVFIASSAVYYIKTKNKHFLFSCLLFAGFSAPFLNVLTPVSGILAERLAYFSSTAFCLIISVLISPHFKNFTLKGISDALKKPAMYISGIAFICFVYVNNRNTNWFNKLSLFEHDIKHLAESAKANSLLGNEYFEMFQSPNKKYPVQTLVQKCLYHYNTAVGNDSSFYSAYNNAGVVYYNYLNDIPSAKKYFTLAIRHKDQYYQAYENLGNCYKQEKNISKAFENYKKAITINPKGIQTYFTCINLFFENKQYEKTLAIIKVAESVFPNNYELTAQKANCYFLMGQTSEALTIFEEAYVIFPNNDLAKFLSENYLKIGNTDKHNMYKNK